MCRYPHTTAVHSCFRTASTCSVAHFLLKISSPAQSYEVDCYSSIRVDETFASSALLDRAETSMRSANTCMNVYQVHRNLIRVQTIALAGKRPGLFIVSVQLILLFPSKYASWSHGVSYSCRAIAVNQPTDGGRRAHCLTPSLFLFVCVFFVFQRRRREIQASPL